MSLILKVFILTILLCAIGVAQESGASAMPNALGAPSIVPSDVSDYVLGPGDQISLVVPDLDDQFSNKMFRIDMSGDVSLPTIGHLKAAGLTLGQLEVAVLEQLRKVLKDPQVTITLASYGSEPVSVLGAVNKPGICQLEGRKTLFEVLSMAGGLRPDAGSIIKITRRSKAGPIPLPATQVVSSGTSSTASVRVRDLMNSTDSAVNIAILPGDAISVEKAQMVYAVGSVTKPGGFILDEHGSLSALQVVSLAQGLLPVAASSKAEILRVVGQVNRTDIPVNLKTLMEGRGTDVQLQADDILFVPHSGAKNALTKGLNAAVAIGTGIVIFGKY